MRRRDENRVEKLNVNKEQELANKLDKPDLLIRAGSRLYGTNTPESDYDYRGFVIPPFEYLVGLSNFKHSVSQKPDDTVIYSLKRFFELLILGDPTMYEILFAPKSNIIECSHIGSLIIRNRYLFACKQFARRIRGYAQSEWRKVTGTQLVPIKRIPSEDKIIENIRQVFHPQKDEMDEIIRLLFLNHSREVRSARRKLGAKRKEQIERYGYCTSSACHTIRLLGQLKELMKYGKITFPRPNAKELLAIKQGEYSLDETTDLYDALLIRVSEAEEDTHLPDHAPILQIQTMYDEIIAYSIKKDKRIENYSYRYGDR